jgi:serine/threonine-protein kinase
MIPELGHSGPIAHLPAPPDGLAVGSVLQDTYRIIGPIAEGGFGKVYLAAHTRLPGRFAVKLLHRNLARDPEALARFRQEAEITSTLSHPHIVQVVDYNVTDGGVPYLVMELLQGRALSQLIASSAPLSPHRAIPIIEQIAQALYAAHQHGIVHRDLKPDNIMLLAVTGADDFVKILDFGISKASWRTRLTQNDTVSGTPQYMAPEQARAQREQIDHRADQFSLAAIAYTLLTGREPFSGEDPVVVLYQVVHEDPARPSHVNPALGMLVDAVISRGLAKDPANRFPSVVEFAAALRAAVAEITIDASQDVEPDAPPVRDDVILGTTTAFDEPDDGEIQTEDVEQVEAQPPGRETRRLIRRVRWRQHRPRRLLTLTLCAGLLATAWFHPATRTVTRAGWHRVDDSVSGLFARIESLLRPRTHG